MSALPESRRGECEWRHVYEKRRTDSQRGREGKKSSSCQEAGICMQFHVLCSDPESVSQRSMPDSHAVEGRANPYSCIAIRETPDVDDERREAAPYIRMLVPLSSLISLPMTASLPLTCPPFLFISHANPFTPRETSCSPREGEADSDSLIV